MKNRELFNLVLALVLALMIVSIMLHINYSKITPFFLGSAVLLFFDIFALAMADISMGPNAILFPQLGLSLGRHENGVKLLNNAQFCNLAFVVLSLLGVFLFVRGICVVYFPEAAEVLANAVEKFWSFFRAL